MWCYAKDCSEVSLCNAFWSQFSLDGDVAVHIDLAACCAVQETACVNAVGSRSAIE